MYYKVLETNETYFDIDNVIDACIDEEYHTDEDDYFEEWINDRYGSIDICGDTYYAYDILSEYGHLDYALDEYRESQNDNDRENARYELEHATDCDEVYIQAYTVKCYDDAPAGDYDGDEDQFYDGSETLDDLVNNIRQFYDDQASLEKMKNEADAKVEDDMMKLFQVIK